ncbi:hypothetical protein SAMN04490243_2734 [Robiginitalea myxolifaciens]|uniref:Uncharacterized protein n=1 Tax=Robiginitalea myxolifaciens TaxID=400055 RepID=A0A1I6HGT0_9FLAO|nr:hypothetical protein [Robiginitalea myxolifaciens]SFR53703.1 hypothetical protein SAMN04490243_2734 [Robiginitalea myxolifaciens]
MKLHTSTWRSLSPLLLVFCITAGLKSCNSDDISSDGFDPITESLLYGSISPEAAANYFEIRLGFCPGDEEYSILHSQGTACEEVSDPETCEANLEGQGPDGFGYNLGCLPGCCTTYIITENQGEFASYDSREELLTFLGRIDSRSDALLWVQSDQYYFPYDDVDAAGIRDMPDGSYRIIALQTVAFCAPIITEQVLLEVSPDGSIRELERREYSRLENACV